MLKIFRLGQTVRLHSIFNIHGYKFSKKLKQKIKHQLKNEKTSQAEDETQNYLRSYPTVQHVTFAEKKGFDLVLQFLPVFLQIGTCIAFCSQPYTGFYIYNLFGAQKILGLILLANLAYSKRKLYNLFIISGVVLPLFIPITNLYGMGAQILHFIILISNNPTQIDDTSYLTKEQRDLISMRHRVKLILYLCILGIFALKGLYHYEVFQLETKIKLFNQKSKNMATKTEITLNQQKKSS